jgi:hypothetical protein
MSPSSPSGYGVSIEEEYAPGGWMSFGSGRISKTALCVEKTIKTTKI